MTFLMVKEAADKGETKLMWWGIGFYLLTMAVIISFQYLVYKKDQPFQKSLKKEIEREDFLINKRDLIIKKNLTASSLTSYDYYLAKTHQKANRRDLVYTLSWVVPSYSLVRMSSFIFLPFAVKSDNAYSAVTKIIDLADSTKKITERLRDYPYGLSAQKQINNFLALPERNDIQKNILIDENIKSITLKGISFSYPESKQPVLRKLDWEFEKGKINHLTGANAYAEHENLIENGLSTGQKQLVDLNKLFINSGKKEIFIFDEADNALDETNRQEFRQKDMVEINGNKLTSRRNQRTKAEKILEDIESQLRKLITDKRELKKKFLAKLKEIERQNKDNQEWYKTN
ncbi:2935_t:CDS:2 [Funneliformis geosporum]|uniref:2935_t:CDS:1 n=1 Tax=Funneliformis geosporum TaxID=1117311 RepID=A0A9W4WL49_9GLOM|nr:2935_t:CDS:2 [Funneliformis geosporum]